MGKYYIDKVEMDCAIKNGDENKIYFYFDAIAQSIKYHHPDIEDWRMIAIARAFRYLPQYNENKGSSFSYFYRIIKMELMYQYRRFQKMNRLNKVELDENISYEQKYYGDNGSLIMLDGKILTDDEIEKIKDIYNKYKNENNKNSKYYIRDKIRRSLNETSNR